MFKEAYQRGILQALTDAGITKTAGPLNQGRLVRALQFMGKHPEPFGSLGGAGVGAGTTALAGGDVDDILLGTGVGALAGGVSGMGLRALRNSRVIQEMQRKMQERLSAVELQSDLSAMGVPQPTAEEIAAEKIRLGT